MKHDKNSNSADENVTLIQDAVHYLTALLYIFMHPIIF